VTLFPTTRWTLVLQARSPEALTALLEAYRAPLYVFARKAGLSAADAEDAVHGFIIVAIERDLFARADKERGKLRSFLKSAFRNHLTDAFSSRSTQKRGGGAVHVDLADAEAFVASSTLDPERAFDAKWARVVMQQALARLEADFAAGYPLIRAYFDGEIGSLKDAAATAGMSESALKSLLHRARGKYREHLLALIGDTVDADPEGELRWLMEAAA
jgi:RNA polymerase sigma-70 factor (ECF subfamily)